MTQQEESAMGTESLSTVTLEIVNKEVQVGDVDESDGTVVSGIALGAGDVTVGQSGTKKKWPADTLKDAAPTLAGSPLVVDHENNSQSVVGKVTKSAYKEGVGVIYEAILYDEELARKVENGLLEVSIRGYHGDPAEMEKDDEGAAIIDRLVFDNLSIVPDGASPSNTLEMGEHAELEANLAGLFEGDDVSNLSESEDGNYNPSEGDLVAWTDDDKGMDRFGKVVDTTDDEMLEVLPEDDNETVEVDPDEAEPWHKSDDSEQAADDSDKESFNWKGMASKHNERVEESWKETDASTLEEVYNRGLEHFTPEEAPDGLKAEGWAMARLNAFLNTLMQGEPVSEKYTQDADLLPEGHPAHNSEASGGKAQGIDRNVGKQAGDIIESSFDELFESIKKAQTRAKEMGLEGHHQIDVGGKKFYMPGESHAEFIKTLADEASHDEAPSTEQAEDEDEDWMNDDSLSFHEKLCRAHDIESEMLETVADLGKDEIYAEWKDATNMDADSMSEWMQHPSSQTASIRPVQLQKRTLRLMETPKDEWGDTEVESAKRAVSFITRMRSDKNAEKLGSDGGPSEWAVTLANWGYNPFDGMPPEPDTAANLEVHFPDYNALDAEGDWSAPDFEDFREPYNLSDDESWDDLDTEMRSAISEHYLYSADGWPPEDFGDLKFPVVRPDGTLVLAGLRSAKSFVGRSDIPEEEKERLREVLNDLAKREFDKDWTETEPTEQSVDIPSNDLKVIQSQAHSMGRRSSASLQQFKEVYRRGRDAYEQAPDEAVAGVSPSEFALERVDHYSNLLEVGLPKDERYSEDNDLLPRNHPRKEPMSNEELTQSQPAGFREFAGTNSDEVEATEEDSDSTMTEEDNERVEELEAAVEELESRNDELLEEIETVRAEYAEALSAESPFSEEELIDKFSVEELRDKYDEYDEAQLASAGPAPEAGDAGEAELSANEEDEERLAELKAQRDNYEKMGWDAALADVESEIEELRN